MEEELRKKETKPQSLQRWCYAISNPFVGVLSSYEATSKLTEALKTDAWGGGGGGGDRERRMWVHNWKRFQLPRELFISISLFVLSIEPCLHRQEDEHKIFKLCNSERKDGNRFWKHRQKKFMLTRVNNSNWLWNKLNWPLRSRRTWADYDDDDRVPIQCLILCRSTWFILIECRCDFVLQTKSRSIECWLGNWYEINDNGVLEYCCKWFLNCTDLIKFPVSIGNHNQFWISQPIPNKKFSEAVNYHFLYVSK